MQTAAAREAVLAKAKDIATEAADGQAVPVAKVLSPLKQAGEPPKERKVADQLLKAGKDGTVHVRRKGRRIQIEFDGMLDDDELRAAVDQFLAVRKESAL
ncbi:hypothetical protein GCM10011415_38000 [Salipiger pallidus]|uniref:Uncharacterized protein n=1 Tax=Salipiger pallidus TaxID=1775170 RepID=A0A8J2ZNC9_9RHOB|nr:hypothetical protein [Salipiger pallidus]GGG84326.1 hypothetical protein GCM10011415_38000 [Salipiger pallidus]